MNGKKKLKLAAAVAGLYAACVSTQAVTAEDDTLALEEVVVTATKRGDASLQEIAMSISVASEDMIAKQGLVGMDDFSALNTLHQLSGSWSRPQWHHHPRRHRVTPK